jgi:hypothetical protein
LNYINNHLLSFSLSQLNIYSNLNQSKQNRWLLKNSLLSNTINTDLYYFTQAKTLIGNTLYNSLNTSSNIWTSSKFSQLSKSAELINLSTFQTLNNKQLFTKNSDNFKVLKHAPASLINFNFFETSKLWNNKKYFITNQLKSNTLQLNNTSNFQVSSNLASNLNQSKLMILLNMYTYSLTHQLVKINNFITDDKTNRKDNTSISQKSTFLYYEAFSDFDHLKNFNLILLLHTTSVSATTNLPIYVYTQNLESIAKWHSKLKFNSK